MTKGRHNKNKKRKKSLLTILACVIVFAITYTMILPALTVDQELADEEAGFFYSAENRSEGDGKESVSASETNEAGDDLIAMPAQDWSEQLDDMQIRVHADDGVLPYNITNTICSIEKEDKRYQMFEEAAGDRFPGQSVSVWPFELHFTDADGNEVVPSGKVEVEIECAAVTEGQTLITSGSANEEISSAVDKIMVAHIVDESAFDTAMEVKNETAFDLVVPAKTTEVDAGNQAISFASDAFIEDVIWNEDSHSYALITAEEPVAEVDEAAEASSEAEAADRNAVGDQSEIYTTDISLSDSNADSDTGIDSAAEQDAASGAESASESAEDKIEETLSAEGRDYTIHLYYDEEAAIPAGASLAVEEIRKPSLKYRKYLNNARDAISEQSNMDDKPEIPFARFYDITILDDAGNEIEPKTAVRVEIAYKESIDTAEHANFKAVHFAEDETQVLDAAVDGSGNDVERVVFDAEGFSVYGVVYTVDFTYSADGEMYEFSLPGGEQITLSELIGVLGIIEGTQFESTGAFLEEVADVEFSDPSLVRVVKVDTDTTVGQIKDALGLVVEYSAELTEEDIEKINGSSVPAGDWVLISLRAFSTEETLTITMTNGDVVAVRVMDAQHVEELALLLESAAIYENGNLISWPATVRENKFYDIRLTFKENSVYQFLDTEDEMYYPVPEGMNLGTEDFTHDFSMDVGDGVVLEGNTVKYDAATNRFIVKWNTGDKTAFNKLIASNSAEFRLDFKAKFDFTKDNIEFSENVIGKVIKDTSYDVDVEKAGVYNEDEDRIDYTVTVTSYGDSKDIHVKDELFGTALTYISEGENHGVRWRAFDKEGNPTTNDTIGAVELLKTKKDIYPDREVGLDCGFEVKVGQMADGEKIEFTYSAAVDYDKLTGSGTRDETFNKVEVITPTGKKEKEHSFTGSLHYVKLQKDHETPINWNGDNATVKWFVTVNEECKVGMKGTVVSDRIYAGDIEAMDYSGSGLHIAVYDDKGAFVGQYDVPWEDSFIQKNALGIDAETEEIEYASWNYTIPDEQAVVNANGDTITINNGDHYKYVFSYTTVADKSLMIFDGYIGNEASESKTDNEMQDGFYPPGTGTVPEVHKAVEPQRDETRKAPNGSNEEYIYWVITFDRQRYDLTRCVIEDNNPTLWGNAEPVDVSETEGEYEYLYVEGLTANESWEVSSATDTRTTIKFYQDQEKKKPGLLRANDAYTGIDGAPDNTITIHLRTKNSAIWMDGTLTKYWPRNHTNTVTWIPNAHQVEADATATPDVRKIIKEGIQVGTIIRDGVSLPVFRYELFLVGIDENSFPNGTLVLNDTFDTAKLALIEPGDLTEVNGFEYTQALQEDMGNNRIQAYWDQKLKGYGAVNGWIGPVPVTVQNTEAGIQFSITKTDFDAYGIETVDGEQVNCLRYSLPYYLVVKDAQTAQKIAKETMDARKDIAEFENAVTWNNDQNLSDSAKVEAEFKPAQKSILYNDQRDLATYQLTLNPQGMKLNEGQMIRVEDAYENLAVDFSTIDIKTVPEDRKSQINWAYHNNKGTFWIPDETVVIITYQAQPIGDAGKNVTIKNELTMLTWKETVEKTVTLNSESEGSAGDYNIRLFKYQDDFMNQPLSGAIFQLFEVGDGAAGDVQTNGRWYKPVTYQKMANVDSGSEEYKHTAADIIEDDVFLHAKKMQDANGKGIDVFYPSRLHHKVGDAIYFSTGTNGYSDIHLSQSRDGLALERGKQYYLYEVVTPDGYDKEDIYWSFIIDDMDFFDSAHGIYQYRDGGVLTVSNESSQDKGIVLTKSFAGNARDALDWNQVEFEIVGVDKDGKEVFRRDVSFADFVKYKLKLPTLPSGNGPYTYTITEKNANVVTATRATTVKLTKTTAGDIANDGEPNVTTVAPTVRESTADGYKVSFTITDEDLKATSETAFKIAFENNYVEKPVELTLNKKWGENASKLMNKTLTLALYKDGSEYPLYKDGDTYKPVELSTADPKPEAVCIVLNDTTDWTVKVTDLPRYENGRPIVWTVKEVGASFTQDGNAITVSGADMDMQFNITATENGIDDKGDSVTKIVKVEHAEAPIDTTSAEKANLTLNNELATLTTVKVEKKWYNEAGEDVTSSKEEDDAVTYDLYRTKDELPKGGKERITLKVLPYRSDKTHLSDMEHILTDEIEVANGDVLEFEVEALVKNVNQAGTWWAWWFDFVSPVIHLDCAPWEQSLNFISVKNESEVDLITAPATRYDNSAYSQTTQPPKIFFRVVINNVEHINGHQNSIPEYTNTPSLLIRNWKDANITVRNVTQESENLTHAKLEQFVNEHSATTELFREGLTLGELNEWNSVNNYPDGYTYFAIEHTPAGYEDTYSIVDTQDEEGNVTGQTITIENRPVKIEDGEELGTLTVQKAVNGLPDTDDYRNKEYQFRIKNGTKYLVKTGQDAEGESIYKLLSIAEMSKHDPALTLDSDATYSIRAGASEIRTFGGLYPAIYMIEEVGNPQVTGYTLETTYSGNGRIGVNLGKNSSATITNTYTPEETQVTFGKLWADGDNKPIAWPEGQSIELVVRRYVKDVADSVDNNFALTYTFDADGATLKSTIIPQLENSLDVEIEPLTENVGSPYYAYRYQLSGLSKKVLTGGNAGKEWVYYVTETVPSGAAYEAGYGNLNGTAVSVSKEKQNAEAASDAAFTDTEYVINQFSQKEITFTKNWYDGVSSTTLNIWPQREKPKELDADGNVVDPNAQTEYEDVPITVTLRRKFSYGIGQLTDYDPAYSVTFVNLTSSATSREQNTSEGKLTLKMENSGGNFIYTISGLKEKGELDGHSGEWKYYIIESAVDGYSTSYALSKNSASEGSFTDEGGTIKNTKKLGTIVVEKKVEGLPECENDKEFSFTVKNTQGKYLTADGGLADASSAATAKVKAGEKAVFSNVPVGEYTVGEIGTDENGAAQIYGYKLAVSVEKGGVVSIADDDVKTVTVTNTYTQETKDFVFNKIWYGVDSNDPTDWMTDSITVTLNRSFKPDGSEEIKGEPITMTIFPKNGSSGYDYIVEKKTSPYTSYEVKIKELEKWVPKDKLPGGVESGEWTYTLVETVPSGYSVHYFMKDSEQYQGAKYIDDGGKIENRLETYELPSTGGPGTTIFTILGSILITLAGVILVRRRRIS